MFFVIAARFFSVLCWKKKLTKKFPFFSSRISSGAKTRKLQNEQQQTHRHLLHSDLMWKICFNFMTFSLTHPDSGGSLDNSFLEFSELSFGEGGEEKSLSWQDEWTIWCLIATPNWIRFGLSIVWRPRLQNISLLRPPTCLVECTQKRNQLVRWWRLRRWRRSPSTNRFLSCYHTENEPHDSMPPTPEKKTHKKNIWSCLWCCVLLLYLYDDAFVAGEKLAQKIDKQASFSLHPTAKAAEPAPSEKLFNDEIAPRGEAAGVWIETRWCFFVWCNNCFWMELFIRSKRDFPLVLLFRENLTVFPFWLKLFAWTMSAHLIVENWLQIEGLRFDLNTGPAWYLDQNQQHLLFSCFNASYLKPS